MTYFGLGVGHKYSIRGLKRPFLSTEKSFVGILGSLKYVTMDAMIVTKPTIVATSRPLSQARVSKAPAETFCCPIYSRVLHVHRSLSDDDDDGVHHKSTDRISEGTLDRHQEPICSLL
jgi:hypothetical protein